MKKIYYLDTSDPSYDKIISFLDKCGHKQSKVIAAFLAKLAETIPISSSKDVDMVLNLIRMMSFSPSAPVGIQANKSRPKPSKRVSRTVSKTVPKEISKETPKEIPKAVPEPPKEVVMSDEDVMKELGTQENASSFITDEEQALFDRMRALDPDLDTGGD